MGDYVIKMPDIGEGIAEAEIAEWLVGVGDAVEVDAPLVEVMTDKARVEIPSSVAGTVMRLGAEPGGFVAVGAELIRLAVAGRGNVKAEFPAGDAPEPAVVAGTESVSESAVSAKDEIADTDGKPTATATETDSSAPALRPGSAAVRRADPGLESAGPTVSTGGKVLAAPAVRGRALQAGVKLADVPATGADGRVTAADLAAHLSGTPAALGPSGTGQGAADAVEVIPIKGIRRITAHRIAAAWAAIPHITIVEEVDVTALEKLRNELEAGGRARPTVLPFLIRALVRALAEQPELNAHFDDETETIRRYAAVHVGIATQAPDGLKVPVLRNAHTLDLWQTAAGVGEVSESARSGKATREQLGGSTITVTSLGRLGAIATTPIVNRPEVAIVGVNRMVVRPLWNGTSFEPRTVMNTSCSFDHRVIDGWAAATFVARLKALLETPALIFVPG